MLATFGDRRGETPLLQRAARRWPIVAAAVVVALAVAALTAPWDVGSPPQYERVTKRVFYEVPSGAVGGRRATRVPAADKAASMAAGGEVPARAAARLGMAQSALVERTSARSRGDVSAIEVSVVAQKSVPGPTAYDMVTVLADELLAYLRDLDRSDLVSQRDQLVQQVDLARQQVDEIDAQAAAGSSPSASAPSKPGPPTLTGPSRSGAPTTAAGPAAGSPSTTAPDPEAARAQAQRNLDTLTARLAALSVSSPAGLTWFAVSEPTVKAISRAAYENQITIGQLGQNVARSSSPTSQVADGVPDPGPTELTFPLRLLTFGAFGLLAGIAAAFVLALWDTRRIDDQRTAEEIFDVGVVGDLGSRRRRRRPPLMTYGGRSKWDERQRALTGNVLHALGVTPADTGAVHLEGADPEPGPVRPDGSGPDGPRQGRVLMVASATASEGKTTLTANLSVAAAEAGHRVLAVGCDFRRPRLHDPLPRADGEPLDEVPSPTHVPRLDVASVVDDGARPPFEIVAEQRRLVAAARREYDVIVLDTAPLLVTDDATSLIPVVDGMLVVVRAGHTLIEAGERLSDLLHLIGAPVLGVALLRFHRVARLQMRRRGRHAGRRPAVAPVEVTAEPAPVPEPTPAVDELGGAAERSPGDDGLLVRS